jgi:hypothetical protein
METILHLTDLRLLVAVVAQGDRATLVLLDLVAVLVAVAQTPAATLVVVVQALRVVMQVDLVPILQVAKFLMVLVEAGAVLGLLVVMLVVLMQARAVQVLLTLLQALQGQVEVAVAVPLARGVVRVVLEVAALAEELIKTELLPQAVLVAAAAVQDITT